MTSLMNIYTNATSYIFPNAYFFDDVPEYEPLLNGSINDIPKNSHMLRHVYRSKHLSKGKSFLNTEFAITITSHRVDRPSKEANVTSSIALAHHYRSGCQRQHVLQRTCKNFRKDLVLDKVLWEFKDKLASRSNETLSKLNIEV